MQREEADHATHRACARMHLRLIEWGNVWLRGGSGIASTEPTDSDSGRHVQWTGLELDRARLLNSIIIRLPDWRHNVLLQVFYKTGYASHWHTIHPREQRLIERDLTAELNARIVVYRVESRTHMRSVNARDFQNMRWDAIAELVRVEARRH